MDGKGRGEERRGSGKLLNDKASFGSGRNRSRSIWLDLDMTNRN